MLSRIACLMVSAIALAGCSPKEFADLAYKMERWPGQRLGGTEQPLPADFGFINQSQHDLIQFKVQGDLLPHVVNLWGVGIGDSVYLWTAPSTGWNQRVEKRPEEVWIRVADDVYALSASHVEDGTQRQLIYEAFMAKYGKEIRKLFGGLEPKVEHFEIFYRLAPRS